MTPLAVAGIIMLLAAGCQADGEISAQTKAQITTGLTEFKNVLDSMENLPFEAGFLNKIKNLSGFLGVVGGLVSFALAFIPAAESSEMKLMKKEFSTINVKLDRISFELEIVKNLISLKNQRSEYVWDALKIIHGYHRFTQRYLTEIAAVKSCYTTKQCVTKRLSISESYVNDFNVKANLRNILSGADSLLTLINNTYECNIPKIERFANGIIELAFEGKQVDLVYEKLTVGYIDISKYATDFAKRIYRVRNKVEEIKASCYNQLDIFIQKDIEKAKYQTNDRSNSEVAASLKADLDGKYPWLYWNVIAYTPHFFEKLNLSQGSYHLNKSSFLPKTKILWKDISYKIHSLENLKLFQKSYNRNESIFLSVENKTRMLWVIPQDIGTYINLKLPLTLHTSKVWLMRKKIRHGNAKWNVTTIFLPLLKEFFTNSVILSRLSSLFVVSQSSEFATTADKAHGSYWFHQRIPKKKDGKTLRSFHIIATFFSSEQIQNLACSKSCNGNGKCIKLPYSSKSYCRCKDFYEGDNCQIYNNVTSFTSTFAATSQIPKYRHVCKIVSM